MYHDRLIEAQIAQYSCFFNSNWNLLAQTLIELGAEPDNRVLRRRVRGLTTILQLTTVTLDMLRDKQLQVEFA